MVIMEDESSCASDSADSSFSTSSSGKSVNSTPSVSPSLTPSSSPSTSNLHCHTNGTSDLSPVSASSHMNGGSDGAAEELTHEETATVNGNKRILRSTRRPCPPPSSPQRACTPPPTPAEKVINKGPPTPHKIQSLDEKSLRLDENYLAISPTSKNAHNNHITITANNAKPLYSTQQNKT